MIYGSTGKLKIQRNLKRNVDKFHCTSDISFNIWVVSNVTSSISSFVDKISDMFDIKPLQVSELNTLSESQTNTVNELVVKNNLNQTLFFNWQFQTGEENLTSTLLNSTGGNVFVYIASNYSDAGVFRTRAIVNSSSYTDNQTGVVVT